MASGGTGSQTLIPPDETFWLRYSPHHEFPLANVTSFVAHVLAFGLILLLVVAIGPGRAHQVPVEAVRLGLGGGGGDKRGIGDGPAGGPPAVEASAKQDNPNAEPNTDERRRPDLEAVRSPDLKQDLNPDAKRAVNRPNPAPSMRAFARLNETVRAKIRPRDRASKGGGGAGSNGGKGDGDGPGIGPGRGPGDGKPLNRRERLMHRLRMHFQVRDGADYLRQLADLGAILAIRVREGSEPDYKIVRDLKHTPAKLVDEDLTKIQQIYWVDEDPESVRQVMATLGLTLRPSHFIAFMPLQLEEKLFEMEKKHSRGKPEDQIKETHFRVKRIGSRYQAEFESISFE
jgi:hypothetical protein